MGALTSDSCRISMGSPLRFGHRVRLVRERDVRHAPCRAPSRPCSAVSFYERKARLDRSHPRLTACIIRGVRPKVQPLCAPTPSGGSSIRYDKKPGVLEVTDLGDECELKLASNRDGGWATALAREVASVKR